MSKNINSDNLVAGLHWAALNLSTNKSLLNTLNIFPVADGDTGTNMYMSIKSAWDNLSNRETPKELFKQVSDTLLNCSLGNSGTILTLFFQGFQRELPVSKEIDSVDLIKSLASGYSRSFNFTSNPIDGTILSVARKISDLDLLSHDSYYDEILNPWNRICNEAFSVLPLTAVQNPFLRESNILDAGAFGFCMILDGFRIGYDLVENDIPANIPDYTSMKNLMPVINVNNIISGTNNNQIHNQFCTEILLQLKTPLTYDSYTAIHDQLSSLGDCLLIVPDKSKTKIHIHTHSPLKVRTILQSYGFEISYKVEDMLHQ